MKYFKFTVYLFPLLLLPSDVKAYLDPGTGSYIVQLFIGVVAGGLFAVKIFWTKIRTATTNMISKIHKHDRSGNK